MAFPHPLCPSSNAPPPGDPPGLPWPIRPLLTWSLLTSSSSQLHEGGHRPASSAWSPTLLQGQSLLAMCTPESKSLFPCPCHTAFQLPPSPCGLLLSVYLPLPCGSFLPPILHPEIPATWPGLGGLLMLRPGSPRSAGFSAAPSLRGSQTLALGTHWAAVISLSDSHQTSWMSLNKGHILNYRILFFSGTF